VFIPWYVYAFKRILKKDSYYQGISLLEIANFVHLLAKKNAYISFRTHITFFQGIIGKVYKFLIRMLYPMAGTIIVNSEENKYTLADYLGISFDRIQVLYNPLDIDKIASLCIEELSLDIKNHIQGKKVFITHARLIKSKHFDLIIRGFKSVSDAVDTDFVYFVIGDGPELTNLQALVNKLGLQKYVFFLGWQQNVFKYLAIADYYVYASSVEGFPNVLLEALAMKLPIITSHFVSGAKEVIFEDYNHSIHQYPAYGKNGVLLDLDNYDQQFVHVYIHITKF
jgi:glycosyltransferase involved in cell wall biosynthesis